MRILVACEESQAVTIELRRLGHEAYSCDIQDCSGGHPEWHIKSDALELLKLKWDMIIAHPPCTYLTTAGANRTFPKPGIANPERFAKGEDAARFFMAFWNADCPRIAIENPLPMRCFGLPKYSQIIHPYMFGDPWRKRTCMWLKGLPPGQHDSSRGADRILGAAKWTKGERVLRWSQRPEITQQDLPRHRPSDGRTMGRTMRRRYPA